MRTALTPKQISFIGAFIETGSKAEAYRRSYNCGKMSNRTIIRKAQEVSLLPKVAVEIEKHFSDMREYSKVTAERVLDEISALAFTDYTEFVEVSDGKYRVRNLGDLTKEQRRAIKSVRPIQTKDGSFIEVELHSKLNALRQLAKSMGLDGRKPQAESQQIHIHLDMRGDAPIDVKSDVVDVTSADVPELPKSLPDAR